MMAGARCAVAHLNVRHRLMRCRRCKHRRKSLGGHEQAAKIDDQGFEPPHDQKRNTNQYRDRIKSLNPGLR